MAYQPTSSDSVSTSPNPSPPRLRSREPHRAPNYTVRAPAPASLPHSGHLSGEARRSYPHPKHNPAHTLRRRRTRDITLQAGAAPVTAAANQYGKQTLVCVGPLYNLNPTRFQAVGGSDRAYPRGTSANVR
jgi:hypothetical protein